MYGAINPPATGDKTFAAFAASIPDADEPGFGITAPFTPPSADGDSTPVIGTGSTTNTAAGATPTGTDDQLDGASIVSVRSGVVVALAGVIASLIL